MHTLYEALKRAKAKDFGKWYRLSWRAIPKETQAKIKSKEWVEKYWHRVFLPTLRRLYIEFRSSEEICVNGELLGDYDFEEVYSVNTRVLSDVCVDDYSYWVFCSYSFDANFSLRGFKGKEAALAFWRTQKKRHDFLYHSFLFRW